MLVVKCRAVPRYREAPCSLPPTPTPAGRVLTGPSSAACGKESAGDTPGRNVLVAGTAASSSGRVTVCPGQRPGGYPAQVRMPAPPRRAAHACRFGPWGAG